MKNTTPIKSKAIVIKLTGTPNAPKGHKAHQSGSGKHADRRLKRMKTRTQQNQSALSDW